MYCFTFALLSYAMYWLTLTIIYSTNQYVFNQSNICQPNGARMSYDHKYVIDYVIYTSIYVCRIRLSDATSRCSLQFITLYICIISALVWIAMFIYIRLSIISINNQFEFAGTIMPIRLLMAIIAYLYPATIAFIAESILGLVS